MSADRRGPARGRAHQHPEAAPEISTPEGVRALELPPRVPLHEREENLYRFLREEKLVPAGA